MDPIEIRWVGFLIPITKPLRVARGDVIAMRADELFDLRGALPDHRMVCDLTPTVVAMVMNPRGIPTPLPASSIAVVPCPHCANESGVSLCLVCGGRRKVVEPHARPSLPGPRP